MTSSDIKPRAGSVNNNKSQWGRGEGLWKFFLSNKEAVTSP